MSSGQALSQAGGEPVEIRLCGTPDGCGVVAGWLAQVLNVTHSSHPYPDRNGFDRVRVYLHAITPDRRGAA